MKMATYPFKIGSYQGVVINDDSLVWTADYLIGAEMTQEQLTRVALDFQVDPGKIPVSTKEVFAFSNSLIKRQILQSMNGILRDHGSHRPKRCYGLTGVQYSLPNLITILWRNGLQ